jgi:hypothetical protein
MKPYLLTAAVLFAVFSPRPALAHCDTLDGPVVRDARAALEARDVAPVLRWVAPERESEIREVFTHALAVRSLGHEAQTLADRFFFETLVRVHRQGEGAPFTGLRPEGSPVEPGVAAADAALETGSADALVALATGEVEKGLRERFARAVEKKRRASESVVAGREYVSAYVDFVHYSENVAQAAGSAGQAGQETAAHVH